MIERVCFKRFLFVAVHAIMALEIGLFELVVAEGLSCSVRLITAVNDKGMMPSVYQPRTSNRIEHWAGSLRTAPIQPTLI